MDCAQPHLSEMDPILFINSQGEKGSVRFRTLHLYQIQLLNFSFFIRTCALDFDKDVVQKLPLVGSRINSPKLSSATMSKYRMTRVPVSHSNLCCLSKIVGNLRWYQNTNAFNSFVNLFTPKCKGQSFLLKCNPFSL